MLLEEFDQNNPDDAAAIEAIKDLRAKLYDDIPGSGLNPEELRPSPSDEPVEREEVPEEKQEDDFMNVMHSDYRDCKNPTWHDGLPKRIISMNKSLACDNQSNKRVSSCLRYVVCQKGEGENAIKFARQALCNPQECDREPIDCLKSNHAIFTDPESTNTFIPRGGSLKKSEAEYQIRTKQQ